MTTTTTTKYVACSTQAIVFKWDSHCDAMNSVKNKTADKIKKSVAEERNNSKV